MTEDYRTTEQFILFNARFMPAMVQRLHYNPLKCIDKIIRRIADREFYHSDTAIANPRLFDNCSVTIRLQAGGFDPPHHYESCYRH